MERSAILLSLVIFGLVGCGANYNSIFREATNDKPKTILIDAKQRAIISNTLKGPKDQKDQQDQLVICAEKSPDVFSVLSSAASGSAAYKAVEVQGAYSSSETGASIGLRTQLTQAQSEYLYYLCQLYASGSISKASVETEIRRFPTTIVALLAIEQLTGYAKPNFVAIGGQGAAGKAENLGGMQRAVDLAQSDDQQKQTVDADAAKKVTEAEKVLDEKNAARKKLFGSVEITQADKEVVTATAALKAAQDKKAQDDKVVADDAKAVVAAEKVLEEKKTAKRNLPTGADTTQADKDIATATTAWKAAQDKQTADERIVADDAKAVAAAEKTRDDKEAALEKLKGSIDTAQVDKDILTATAALNAAQDNKKITGDAAKDSASNLKQIEAARDAAANALSASTSSAQAKFSDAKGSNYYEADAASVQAVATAVTDIVKMITTQTFTTEMCLKSFFEDNDDGRRQLLTHAGLSHFCIDWMKEINTWKFHQLYLAHGLLIDGKTPNPAVNRMSVPVGNGGSDSTAGPYFRNTVQNPR